MTPPRETGDPMRSFLISRIVLCLGLVCAPLLAQQPDRTSPMAATAGAFSINARKDSIGTVAVGSSKTDSLTVTNTGSTTLTISSVKSSSAQFTAGPLSASILAGATRKFGITFAPTTTGDQSAYIVFTHDGPSSPDTVVARGTGALAGFSLNRKSIAYGFVVIARPKADSVSVTNTGTAALVISSVTSSSARYTVSPTSGTIQPGAKSTFTITFTPTAQGSAAANIVFTHNAPTIHDTVAVSGTGTAFSPNKRSIAFGSVPTGTSRKDSVIITNAGSTSLSITAVTSTNGVFTVTPTTASVAAAGTAKFYVTFTPANTTAQTGFVIFAHNGASSPDTIGVSGTGTTPGFSVAPKAIAFGTVAIGSPRRDSVTVSSTGNASLVISAVTSSNAAFTVSPTGATITAGSTRKFYITFTPAASAPQTASIVFTHNAPSAHDTVTVSGAGGTVGFVLNRRTVSFGSVAVGNSRTDSVAVTDTGTAALVIASVVSGNGRFAVTPAAATVPAQQGQTFRITFTPVSASAQSGYIVFTHNAPSATDTVTVSGTGVAPLAAPVLAAPASGASGQGIPVTLSWNAVSGASAYWVEVATDSQFRSMMLSDSSVQPVSRTVSGLPPNTRCYWRVATGNLAGFGPFSAPWNFSTVGTGPVSGTITFSGDVSSTSYRMFGLPGVGVRTAGAILQGTQKTDWRLLRDNGKDTTYPAYYEDLTAGSALNTGEGYWLLQRSNLVIARTDSLPPLGSDGTFAIPLHGGWNMISNPFTVSVGRDAVIAANGLPAGTAFWEHIGAVRTSTGGTTLDPFKGYYFDNGTLNLASLKIPYPSASVSKRALKIPPVDWRMELVFDGDINTDRDNYVGIAPTVAEGPNELDQHEAPLVFDEGFLYFSRPAWDPARCRFATDMRPALGDGQRWDFEVWNPRLGQGRITVNGVAAVPAQYRVMLVDPLNSAPVDLRRQNVYAYATSAKTMQFSLIVGTQAFVEGVTANLVPQVFDLAQNYPNPFNPSTTITYMLASPADVRLEILTVLGQRVRMLDSGVRPAATHTVIWDGRDENGQTVASGVYFCRLVAGGNMIRTRKLLLVK